MLGRLDHVRAVITGGGRGIGRAIADAYADAGAAVVVAARSTSEIDGAADAINARGGRAAAISVDITSDDDVQQLLTTSHHALAGHANVLVNNAGTYLACGFLHSTMNDWERIFDVNLFGTVRMTRAFLPAMVDAGAGRIINIASTAGKWGTANQSAYSASKHALLGLTTAASGVRVNAICPGWVDTELLDDSALARVLALEADEVRPVLAARAPIGRMTTAEEVAALALYMASPEADAMTGVGVTLAGGLIHI
jgi:NAD(P)-dependent dehydrogenase (short-subunit alcohol dehydrogenase family)